jgi:hypothetical protein
VTESGTGEFVDDDVLGPIAFLAVEFPNGRVTGEGFQLLMDLVHRGIIRVLDLEFVARSMDGAVSKMDLGAVEHSADVDITIWQAAESGLLDDDDIATIASSIMPGSLAGIVVYENVWAVPLMSAIGRGNARIIGEGRVAAADVLAALGASEETL